MPFFNSPIFTEIEDQPWFPSVLRNQITDALQYLIIEMKIYDPIIPELLWVMQQSETKHVVDLCTGGTGPWEYLIGAIRNPDNFFEGIILTDLYPNENALKTLADKHAVFSYWTEPVNATKVTEELIGVRTLFSSFHHFQREQAISIIQDAVDKKMPICIFEFTKKELFNLLATLSSTVILFTKLLFKRPLTLSRLLFSYVIPIVPVIYFWDSTVSCLRSYSRDELRTMLGDIHNSESFVWEIGESSSPRSPLKNTFLIGYPKKKRQ